MKKPSNVSAFLEKLLIKKGINVFYLVNLDNFLILRKLNAQILVAIKRF